MAHPEFTLDAKLPKYGVSDALHPHLVRYLVQGGFSYGDPFLTDNDVVKATGRSRSTIRAAFDRLQNEGWIERRIGAGTFVGPKINTVKTGQSDYDSFARKNPSDLTDMHENAMPLKTSVSQRLLRLAMVTSGLGRVDYNNWWLSPQLHGIDSVSEKYGIAVELLGDHTVKSQILSRRFKENRPDVLVSSGSPLNHAEILGEARRFRIPCLLCAVRTPELSMPNIVDNAEESIANAVQHLYDHGHRRIAYVSLMLPHWWTFDRYEGYKKGMRQCGLDHADDLTTLWLPSETNETTAAELKTFIDQKEPTALIFSSSWAAASMRWITGHNGLHVGEDISVVIYDQNPESAGWLGGVQPTVIAPPLFEMGQTIAQFARDAAEGKDVPLLTTLPCKLIEGDSVKKYWGINSKIRMEGGKS